MNSWINLEFLEMSLVIFVMIVNNFIILISLLPLVVQASDQPVCTGLTYSNGLWKGKYKNSASENFDVCFYHGYKGDSPACLEFEQGYRPNVQDHGALCKKFFLDKNRTDLSSDPIYFHPKTIDYNWEPSNCKLEEWDVEAFCKVLGQRKVLFIGDSTMDQTYNTLSSMIFYHYYSINNTAASSHTRILWQHGDRLINRPSVNVGRGLPILEAAERYDYDFDFLFIAAGYHIHAWSDMSLSISDGLYAEHYFPILSTELKHLRYQIEARHPARPLKIIYKTENVGHDHCASFHGPDNSLNNKTNLSELNKNNRYHWNGDIFGTDDRFIFFAKQNDITILRMDPLFSRPDGHPMMEECLHYCAPGPLNIFSRLFYHYLVIGDEKWRLSEEYNLLVPA